MNLPDLDAHFDAVRAAIRSADQAWALRDIRDRVQCQLDVGDNPTVQDVMAFLDAEAARLAAHAEHTHHTLIGD